MAAGGKPVGPKIYGLIRLHDQHPEAVEAELIRAGLRWREDHGPEWCPWRDVWAVVRTASWDSPIARAMEPDEWYWYGPTSAVQIETRDLLRVMAAKQYPHPKVRREQIPKLTLPPWQVDESTSRFAPDPVTKDEIDAHLLRLNGRTPDGRPAPAAKAKRRRLRVEDVRQVRAMLADGKPPGRVAAFFGVSKRTVTDIGARRTWKAVD